MGERTTSREEASLIRHGLMEAIEVLEGHGFTRGQIGACMVGIGFGIVQVHEGHQEAKRIVDRIRMELSSGDAASH